MAVGALVLAGGRGERLGAGLPKAFASLAGKTLLERALRALAAAPEIDWLVPVIPADAFPRYAGLAGGLRDLPGLRPPVPGGTLRQDSMRAGLAALPAGVRHVAVHDAARPLVRAEAVSRVVREALSHGAAILALPLADTVKRVRDGRVVETPPRDECWAAQTPQVFRLELLREALAKAEAEGLCGTDDAQIVERLGVAVRVVPGDPGNWKITHPEDLRAAEARLRAAAGGAG